MKNSTKFAVAITVLMLTGLGVSAENESKEGGEKGKRGARIQLGELRAYRAKQEKARKEYREERKEENEAFHETLKEKEPAEALTAIIAHRKKQYSETKTFFQGMHSELVAYVKETVPAEKQEEVLKKIEERRGEGVAKHQEIHENLINTLEGLKGNEDLTMKQIKETVSKALPKREKGRRNRKNNK